MRTSDANTCELLASRQKDDGRAVVYVHAIGPDYLMAYGLGCENIRAEIVETGRLKAGQGIFYIINRSEAGYSVPYDAIIHHDNSRNAAVVSLIKRNSSFAEIRFKRDSPPKVRGR
jgi:hypothetical protein